MLGALVYIEFWKCDISIKSVGLSDEKYLQFKPYPIPKHLNVQ